MFSNLANQSRVLLTSFKFDWTCSITRFSLSPSIFTSPPQPLVFHTRFRLLRILRPDFIYCKFLLHFYCPDSHTVVFHIDNSCRRIENVLNETTKIFPSHFHKIRRLISNFRTAGHCAKTSAFFFYETKLEILGRLFFFGQRVSTLSNASMSLKSIKYIDLGCRGILRTLIQSRLGHLHKWSRNQLKRKFIDRRR